MTLTRLVWAFIRRRPATWVFHVLLLAVAVAITVSVLLVRQAADARLTRDLAGVDLVVGASGSPLQLVTSAVFQADVPTGNIPWVVAEQIARDPLVRRAVPLSMGDSLGAYRIVGTTRDYAALQDLRLDDGRWWGREMEAVLGATVARRMGLAVGDSFVGAHGLEGGDQEHADRPYRVVGVLRPSGAVADRLVLTDLSSVWSLHEAEPVEAVEGGAHDHDHASEPQTHREVTAVLVQYQSALGAVMLPPRLGRLAGVQTASPPREAQRLNAMIGDGAAMMTRLGGLLLALAAGGFVLALTTAVRARRRELALLKALGASSARLASVVLLEGGALGLAGGFAGLVLGRGLAWGVAQSNAAPFSLTLPSMGGLDALVILASVALGLIGSAPGVWLAICTDPVDELQGR
ncbi:ABC transporter permease [Brevundimonas sp. SL130]|uniref:ABC transporter permease n=1 Tax=Brevundimonas sp. SL130 TaxID=2995143 RepID=UPI00226CA9B3|nr:ABC transporter permease [Brevundimonas sp. SL130]WAC59054.1 ABC transporter permease [Brevundimonas sp. SL130]